MKIFKIFIICILFYSNVIYSQDTSEGQKVFNEAKELYRDGRADNIPNMLTPYLESYSRKQKKEAYRLIILAYLFDDHKLEANKVLADFMKTFPEFKPEKNDTNDLKYLFEYKSFSSNIVFAAGPVVGINMLNPVIKNMGDGKVEGANTLFYGLHLETRIINYLDMRLDVLLSENKFSITNKDSKYEETLNMLYVPFWLIPYYPVRDHRVYLKLGGGICSLMDVSGKDSELGDMEISKMRNSSTNLIGIGAGFSFKIPRGFLTLEGTYMMGSELVDKAGFDNLYDGEGIKLNQLMISLNYSILFYNLKEKKK